jgi:acyl-coenzyme A synthetase/AMP-(fatty) acid ligase
LYYENTEDIAIAAFRKELLSTIPKYMIPTVYIRHNEMPRNPNGKIDRAYLNQKANE